MRAVSTSVPSVVGVVPTYICIGCPGCPVLCWCCTLSYGVCGRYYKPETRGLDFEGLMEDVQVGLGVSVACQCCQCL